MKKSYKIESTKDFLLVLPRTNKRLDELSMIVSKELTRKKYIGAVVFDLLILSLQSNKRFVSMDFSADVFILDSAKIVDVSDSIRETSNCYYAAHPDLIKNSVLPSTLQERICEMLTKYELVEA